MAVKFGATKDPFGSRRAMLLFSVAAGVAAIGIGVVGGLFRWCLERAVEGRTLLVGWAHAYPSVGWLAPVLLVAACTTIGWALTRLTPRASGSGIQDVEAVWHEQEQLPTPDVIPARFVGGVVAIGSGLVVGREGPSVHLGASIGAEVGRWFRLTDYERKLLYTTSVAPGWRWPSTPPSAAPCSPSKR